MGEGVPAAPQYASQEAGGGAALRRLQQLPPQRRGRPPFLGPGRALLPLGHPHALRRRRPRGALADIAAAAFGRALLERLDCRAGGEAQGVRGMWVQARRPAGARERPAAALAAPAMASTVHLPPSPPSLLPTQASHSPGMHTAWSWSFVMHSVPGWVQGAGRAAQGSLMQRRPVEEVGSGALPQRSFVLPFIWLGAGHGFVELHSGSRHLDQPAAGGQSKGRRGRLRGGRREKPSSLPALQPFPGLLVSLTSVRVFHARPFWVAEAAGAAEGEGGVRRGDGELSPAASDCRASPAARLFPVSPRWAHQLKHGLHRVVAAVSVEGQEDGGLRGQQKCSGVPSPSLSISGPQLHSVVAEQGWAGVSHRPGVPNCWRLLPGRPSAADPCRRRRPSGRAGPDEGSCETTAPGSANWSLWWHRGAWRRPLAGKRAERAARRRSPAVGASCPRDGAIWLLLGVGGAYPGLLWRLQGRGHSQTRGGGKVMGASPRPGPCEVVHASLRH